MACSLCEAVAVGPAHPRFLVDFGSAILFAGENQFYPGYCVLVAKPHIRDFHEMAEGTAIEFVRLVLQVSNRLDQAFSPRRLNHAMLGNVVEHVHWHIFPRARGEFDPTAHPWARSEAFAAHPTTDEHVARLRAIFVGES